MNDVSKDTSIFAGVREFVADGQRVRAERIDGIRWAVFIYSNGGYVRRGVVNAAKGAPLTIWRNWLKKEAAELAQ